jgi:hypothetical protein
MTHRPHTTRPGGVFILGILSVASFAVTMRPAVSGAQTRSSIVGTIKDSGGGVLPGVSLSLDSPDMVGGIQATTSGADGTYRFSELAPGIYAIKGSLQGFQTINRTELRVPFGTTLTVDLMMELGAVNETLTVKGESPVIDVKTAAATAKLDNALIEALPQNPNLHSISVFEIFTLTPGVSTLRTAHGGARDANNLMIDGTPSTIPNRAGIDAAGFAYHWIQEVQVVSLGANAEYGDFTGTISNVVLRSGSNRLQGLVDYETTRRGWGGNNTGSLTPAQQDQFKPLAITNQSDTTAQLGGPLVKDRLFFFGGFKYYSQKQIPSGSLGETPRVDKLPSYITKMNWAISPNIKLEGLIEHDHSQVENVKAGPSVQPEANYSNDNSKYLWNERLTWTPGKTTLVELRSNGVHIFENQIPRPPNSWSGPPGHADLTTGIQSVNVASALGSDEGTRTLFGGSVTRWLSQGSGKGHELKSGVELERMYYNERSQFAGGLLYQDIGGRPNQVMIWNGSFVQGTGWRTTLFAQDNWALTNRLTLQPGLRLAINRGSVPVKGHVFSTNPVSPRIGVAWDLVGDHKNLVRAHYGRFHEALLTALYQFLDTSQQSPMITAKVLPDGSFQELTRVTPATNFGIDPNLRHAYVEQYLAAFEREVFTDLAVTAQYIGRRYQDMFAFVDTGSKWAPVAARDPGPDGILGNGDDGPGFTAYNLLNPGQAFLQLTNPSDAWRHYQAVQVSAKKRFSHNWQADVSYTYSKTEGNVSNAQQANVAGAEAGTTGNFVDPNHLINMTGRALYDFPHQVLAQATYVVPVLGGFNISPRYRYQSGQPWGRTIVVRGFNQGSETIRIEPRGTRRNAATSTIDLRLEKTFHLDAAGHTVGLYVDAVNLNNQGAGIVRETSGSSFATLSSWSAPRLFQAGARLTF